MKTKRYKILFVFLTSVICSISIAKAVDLTGTTGSFSVINEAYVNNMNVEYNINTGVSSPVVLTFAVNTETNYDFVKIYSVDASNNATLIKTISGSMNGIISTNITSGKAKVVFTSDVSSCFPNYLGFTMSYSAATTNYSNGDNYMNGRSIVLGNLGIKTSTPRMSLHVNNGDNTDASILATASYGNNLVVSSLNPKTQFGTVFRITHEFFDNERNNGYIGFHRGGSSLGGFLDFGTYGVSRMTINPEGLVGIGTTSPTQALTLVGKLSISPAGTGRDEGFNGNIVVTKPPVSGQYINLVRTGVMPWSIGTVYNTSYFAIGQGRPNDADFNNPPFVINPNGNVGINYSNPQYTLDVKGTIRATEVKVVSVNAFADFVFDSKYDLPKLSEVHDYIQENGHLPNIPSAKEVKENGMSLVDMQVKLLQKVEELTLYVIDQQKEIESLKKELNAKNKMN